MSEVTNDELLKQPIKKLPFSENFILRCKLMDFSTVQEILEIKERDLMSNKDFNYIWLNELLDFLNKYNLLHLMEDEKRF